MSVIATTTAAKGGNIFMNLAYLPVLACCSYLGVSWESLTLLAALLFIDYTTGVAKVYVINRSELKSYKAIAGILAKSSILLLPIVFSIVAKQANIDISSFVDTIITMLVMAETFSIVGNIRSIHARKEVAEVDAVSIVLKKISNMWTVLLKKD